MSYDFPPDVQEQIGRHISTGEYSSEEDVLRAALRALELRNAELAAIAAGIDDMEAGRVRSFEEADAEIRQRLRFSDKR